MNPEIFTKKLVEIASPEFEIYNRNHKFFESICRYLKAKNEAIEFDTNKIQAFLLDEENSYLVNKKDGEEFSKIAECWVTYNESYSEKNAQYFKVI